MCERDDDGPCKAPAKTTQQHRNHVKSKVSSCELTEHFLHNTIEHTTSTMTW